MRSEVSGPDGGCVRFAVVFEQIAATDIGVRSRTIA